MPVPTVITDLSTTIASNSPSGSDARTTADDHLRALAGFVAQLRDGSKNLELGAAATPGQSFTGDANTGVWSAAADTFNISTAGVERVRVNPAGQVGFGVTPSAHASTHRALELGFAGHGITGYSAGILNVASGLYYNGTDWKYGVSSTVVGLMQQNAGAHGWWKAVSGTAGNTATLVSLLQLDASGNLTATANITAYSDERLKENFEPLEVSVKDLASLEVSSFDRTDIEGMRQCGVTAQALQKVMPLAVQENPSGMLSIDYGRAALIAAITIAKALEKRDGPTS